MPILVEEPSVYPDTLLDEPLCESWDRQWWVLYTKARQEKAIARDLLAYDVPFYLPLVERTVVYRRRRVSSYCPVFPGYVFLYGTEDERVRGLTTNRISRVLEVYEPEVLLHDLRQLRQLILSGAPLTTEARMAPGKHVRVRRGPLAGLEGTVTKRRGETRLLVHVDFLQQGASVEIDDFLLEPIASLSRCFPDTVLVR